MEYGLLLKKKGVVGGVKPLNSNYKVVDLFGQKSLVF
jgi:hypothetical protein